MANLKRGKKSVQCQWCGRNGHLQADRCKRKKVQNNTSSRGSNDTDKAMNVMIRKGNKEKDYMLIRSHTMFLDPGASPHMDLDNSIFYREGVPLNTASGTEVADTVRTRG